MKYIYVWLIITILLLIFVIGGYCFPFLPESFLLFNFDLIFYLFLICPAVILGFSYYKIYKNIKGKLGNIQTDPIININRINKIKKIIIYIGIFSLFIFISYYIDILVNNIFDVSKNNRASRITAIFLTIGPIVSLFIAGGMAILEELFFRQLLQNILETKLTKKYNINIIGSIIITGLTFTILHFAGIIGSIGIFILGIILSIIFYIFKDIKLNIFLHFTNNIIGVLVFFFFSPINHNVEIDYFNSIKNSAYGENIHMLDKVSYFSYIYIEKNKEKPEKIVGELKRNNHKNDELFSATLMLEYSPNLIETIKGRKIGELSKEDYLMYKDKYKKLLSEKDTLYKTEIGKRVFNKLEKEYKQYIFTKIKEE